MRKELQHFTVGNSIGGDQEWFTDPWMKLGGCAAVTACDLCIYLAREKGFSALYPFDASVVSRRDYLAFGEKMRPYLHPRATGIDKTSIFLDGFGRYLHDRGESSVRLNDVSGEEDVETAMQHIRSRIDAGFPVPYLMLMHRDSRFKDYMWHWFLLNGYDEDADRFRVKAVSYGEAVWFDFRRLWQTGRRQKGGIVEVCAKKETEIDNAVSKTFL